MKIKILLLLVISIFAFRDNILGQYSQGGVPYSFKSEQKNKFGTSMSLSKHIPVIQMPNLNQSAIDSIVEKNIWEFESFQFAYGFNVDIKIKEASVIDSLETGLLYRCSVKSIGAKSLNIIFKDYNIPLGAKLYLYTSDTTFIKGAFTSNNNKTSKRLAIEPLLGEEIIVEYFEPYYSSFKSDLAIVKVNHDFTGVVLEDGNFGNSGSCQVDVNCQEGNNWQNEKRAVCRIFINGTSLCSGTLINNTSYDGTPYFLTANHCIESQFIAENSVFVFNYESPTCNGVDGVVSQSISGANLKATNQDTDFTLLELSKKPLSTFNPFYAGWNRNNNQGSGGVGIHHPRGDVKKISTYTMSPIVTSCISDFPVNNFYLIDNWISTANGHGVTEGGSSGSPLFNNNHQVIGQLFGGCAGHNDNCLNPSNDFSTYGKIYSSWDLGTNSDSRLKEWLSPNSTDASLNGAAICSEGIELNINITHTISNNSNETHHAINQIKASNIIKSGAIATYKAGKEIVLEPGFYSEEGSDFTAEIEQLNCVVGCYPMNLVAWTSLVCEGDDLCFNITNAENYSISVFSQGATIFHSSGTVTGNRVCTWNTLGVSTGFYSVIVSFSNDCEVISNSYQMFVTSCGKSVVDSISEPADDIISTIVNNISEKSNSNFNVSIYPNPSSGVFTISLEKINTLPYSFQILNSLGSIVFEMEHVNVNHFNVSHTRLPSGVYYIQLTRGADVTIKKLVIN